MASLRDRLSRTWLWNYFAAMEPIDRATALIVLALLSAWVVAFAAIMRSREPGVSAAPQLTAPPFELQFTGLRRWS